MTYVALNARPKKLRERLQRRRNSRTRFSLVKHWGRAAVGRWRRICDRDGFVCWLCGDPINPDVRQPDPGAPTVDHVIPLVLGGSDDDDNLKPAHFGCNSRRGGSLRRRVTHAGAQTETSRPSKPAQLENAATSP